MRVYLVIIDESDEAFTALQFAARRAAKTDGALHLLALVPPQPFNAFAGVQATIEEEARARAETLVTAAAGNILSQGAKMPVILLILFSFPWGMAIPLPTPVEPSRSRCRMTSNISRSGMSVSLEALAASS